VEFGHWIMLPWPKSLVQMKFSLQQSKKDLKNSYPLDTIVQISDNEDEVKAATKFLILQKLFNV
jgi:hypothetical protein